MNVTSEPSAVHTSENSRPMYPEPMMATHGGASPLERASREHRLAVNLDARGHEGVEPVAMMMFCAVHLFPY